MGKNEDNFSHLPVGTRLEFRRTYANGAVSLSVLGVAERRADGWWFVPCVADHKPSRKAHATLERCVPRWVGYPDACTSRVVS